MLYSTAACRLEKLISTESSSSDKTTCLESSISSQGNLLGELDIFTPSFQPVELLLYSYITYQRQRTTIDIWLPHININNYYLYQFTISRWPGDSQAPCQHYPQHSEHLAQQLQHQSASQTVQCWRRWRWWWSSHHRSPPDNVCQFCQVCEVCQLQLGQIFVK